jgi:hypothetical protein
VSRPLITYPAGWTLSVVPDPQAAGAAGAELVASGLDDDDVIVLAGPDARDLMGRLGSSAGMAGRIRRSMQFLTMDQMPDLHVYELALDDGHALVGVRVGDAEERRRAVAVIQEHGGHFINRFGDWSTEEIAPWRGQMPDLPQHLH